MIKDKTTLEYRLYISSLPANAARLNHAVRQHWRVENSLHWCMDVVFDDDQMRARSAPVTPPITSPCSVISP